VTKPFFVPRAEFNYSIFSYVIIFTIFREAEKGLKKEVKILKTIEHRNIITLLGILFENERFSLIIEYAPYGSCTKFLKTLSEKKVEAAWKWPLKYQIAVQVRVTLQNSVLTHVQQWLT